jgi:hypothetical protein
MKYGLFLQATIIKKERSEDFQSCIFGQLNEDLILGWILFIV